MSRLALRLGILAVGVGACFDPLYQDGDPLTSGWVLCCQGGVPSTCFCPQASSCLETLYACPGNRCASSPSCAWVGPTQDAGGVIEADAGSADHDGGVTHYDGGSDGGDAGTSQGYEFCCVSGRVTTCACRQSGCVGALFTPCPHGTCVEGTTSSLCR